MIEQNLEISTQRKGLRKKVYAMQGDSGRTLKCLLTDYQVKSDDIVTFYAVKPSGARIYNGCRVEETVDIELTEQILAEAGMVDCQVEIRSKNNAVVTAFIFTIEVVENLADMEGLVSSNEFLVLEEALQSVDTVLNDYENTLANAKEVLDKFLVEGDADLQEKYLELKAELESMTDGYKEIYNQAIVEFSPLTDDEIDSVFEVPEVPDTEE